MDLISVIVPVYNIEQYVEECVDSIVNQTYRNLEIILVDDGSTDCSGEICDRLAAEDERIIVIHKQNGGLSSARNAGLDIAKGEWIGFVDGDDYIEITMYQELLQVAKKFHAPLAIGTYKEFPVENGIQYGYNKKTEVLEGDTLIKSYVMMNGEYQLSPAVWTRLYHKSLIGKKRFPYGYVHEDVCFTTEVFCQCKRAAYIEYPYYNYRIDRTDRIMNKQFSQKNLSDLIILSEKSIRCLKYYQFENLADYRFCAFYLDIAELYTKEIGNDSKRVLKEYLEKKRNATIHLLCKSNILCSSKVKILLCFISPLLCGRIVNRYRKIKV